MAVVSSGGTQYDSSTENPLNEFLLNPDDDISTLGDPLPQGMTHKQSREGSTIAAINPANMMHHKVLPP